MTPGNTPSTRLHSLLNHRRSLAPDNRLFQLADGAFTDELTRLCEGLDNEETLLVIRALEASMPDDTDGAYLMLKGILRRLTLLHARTVVALAPLSVALSRVDGRHFGEWQAAAVFGAVCHASASVGGFAQFREELSALTWEAYARRTPLPEERIVLAHGHLLLVAGAGADGDYGDCAWFGEHREQVLALWSEMTTGEEGFTRARAEELISGETEARAA